MPAEITQSNARIAEVRFICDNCNEVMGTRMMRKKEAEAQVKKQVLCLKCKLMQDKKTT